MKLTFTNQKVKSLKVCTSFLARVGNINFTRQRSEKTTNFSEVMKNQLPYCHEIAFHFLQKNAVKVSF